MVMDEILMNGMGLPRVSGFPFIYNNTRKYGESFCVLFKTSFLGGHVGRCYSGGSFEFHGTENINILMKL